MATIADTHLAIVFVASRSALGVRTRAACILGGDGRRRKGSGGGGGGAASMKICGCSMTYPVLRYDADTIEKAMSAIRVGRIHVAIGSGDDSTRGPLVPTLAFVLTKARWITRAASSSVNACTSAQSSIESSDESAGDGSISSPPKGTQTLHTQHAGVVCTL